MLSILSWWLVNSIHLCDKEKHKAKQNTKDSDYNVFYYRRRYNIEVSTTIHALKYHLCIYIFMLDEVYSCGQPQSIWFPTTWCRRKEESFLIFFPHCILSLCVVFPFAFALSFSFGFHHFFCFVYQPNNVKKKETNKKKLILWILLYWWLQSNAQYYQTSHERECSVQAKGLEQAWAAPREFSSLPCSSGASASSEWDNPSHSVRYHHSTL